MVSRIELIHDWYAALKAGDIAGALALLDLDVEWIDNELHETGALDDV
jgi:ketosteroid isomerase-like protein